MARNPVVRSVYLALGIVSLGVAFIGVVLPLIPTTGPVILAGFFFARSSDSFDRWLRNNRLFGGIVRDWRAGVGFTPRAKGIAVAAIITTFAVSVVIVIDSTAIRALLILLGISIATFVVTRPTKRQPTDTAITTP